MQRGFYKGGSGRRVFEERISALTERRMTKSVRRQAATMVVATLTLVALSVWVWVRAQGTDLVGA